MARHSRPKPVTIERRTGKLFQASRPLRMRTVLLLIVAAMLIGAVLALALKRVVVINTTWHMDEKIIVEAESSGVGPAGGTASERNLG